MTRPRIGSLVVVMLAALVVPGARPTVPVQAETDLDAFMAQVLARRDENWKKLQQYVLDERERLEIRGPGAVPLWGQERTYTWYIRDGFFVRSPLTVGGVRVDDRERRAYEDQFLARAKRRDGTSPATDAPPAADAPRDLNGLLTQSRQPAFIDNAYFLRFKFEPGHYALAGREDLDGHEALRIEYYPDRLFAHEQDAQARRRATGSSNRKKDASAAVEQAMNKASLVTLWVEPRAHQILKYTFDNVSLDFLPAAWLLRVTDMKATMRMDEPFSAVWLPNVVDINLGVLTALGTLDVAYHVVYDNYREASTGGRVLGVSGR